MNYFNQINNVVKNNSKIAYMHTIGCLFLAGVCMLGMMFDDRMLLDVSVWLKPLKFSLSAAIFIYTVGYYTNLYNYTKRKKNIINHVIAWTTLADILIIMTQGARGVKSHYNMDSLLDGLLFAAMGILVSFSVLVMLIFLVDTLRRKPKVNYSVFSALLIAWISTLYGSYVGGQMLGQQGHNVGVPDGGDGMFLVNWSLEGGDLRIAHFLGLHAIQVMPIAAFFIHKKMPNSPKLAGLLSVLFGISYLGIIALTFHQAKNGIPLVAMVLTT